SRRNWQTHTDMTPETITIPHGLVSALDVTLASGQYSDAGNSTFELRIAGGDPGSGDAVFTWDRRQGLSPGRRGTPTTVVEFASTESFCTLVSLQKEFLELAASNQIRIGGLF